MGASFLVSSGIWPGTGYGWKRVARVPTNTPCYAFRAECFVFLTILDEPNLTFALRMRERAQNLK